MKNKKPILIVCCILAGLLLAAGAGVAVLSSLGLLSPAQEGKPVYEANSFVEEFDENYTSVQAAVADEFMRLDGVLDEAVWEGKKPFTNRFNGDADGTQAGLSMITHMTQKGLYVGTVVTDSNLTYTGYDAPRYNSTLVLNIAADESKGSVGSHVVYMDAKQVVSTSNANVASCAYGVQVEGELGSGATQKMTMELFIPWSALDMQEPEDVSKVQVLLNPLYNAIRQGQNVSTQLKVTPYSSSNPKGFQRFTLEGYVDADAQDAVVGNSLHGAAKTGAWDVSGLLADPENTDPNTLRYTGKASTVWGSNKLAYLSKAAGNSFVFEATIIPVSSTDPTGYSTHADISVMLPGNKLVSFRMMVSTQNFGKNSYGSNMRSLTLSRIYQDYDNGVYEAQQVANYDNPRFSKQEGVRLRLVKDSARYYLYADGQLVWAGLESRGNGTAMPVLFAAGCEVQFKDLLWTNFDGRSEELKQTLQDFGTHTVEVETEGSGSAEADSIAVSTGDSVTLTLTPMENNILTDLLIDGKSVMDQFKKNSFHEGTLCKYTIKNIRSHTTVTAVFGEYEGTALSGKLSITGEKESTDIGDTKIYAYLSDGRLLSFSSAVLADGTYSISLPAGTYSKLYFVSPRYEQIAYKFANGRAITIGKEPVTGKDFVLKQPTFESLVIGPTLSTGKWNIVDNGRYYAQGNAAGNDYNTAYFRNSGSKDFIIKATVKADPGAMIGIMMNGTYNGNSGYQLIAGFQTNGNTTLFGYHAAARPVNWIGTNTSSFAKDKAVFPDNNYYKVIIAKKGNVIDLHINGERVASWRDKVKDYDGNEFDLSAFVISKVGLTVRGYEGAEFSNYSYSTSASAINAVMCRKIKFSNLPSGVSLTAEGRTLSSGSQVVLDNTVTVNLPKSSSYVYAVTVNGEPIPVYPNDRKATFEVTEDSTVVVTAKAANTVSGTVAGGFSGAVTATNTATGESYVFTGAVKKGPYSVLLPDGTYRLNFDLGSREGAIAAVSVAGAAVTGKDLDKTYQKLYMTYMGADPVEEAVMIDNGVYLIPGVLNGNANAVGYFNDTTNPVNNFVIKARVQTEKGQAGIMMYGYDGDKTNPDVLVLLDRFGTLSFYGWGISWKDRVQLDTSKYDPKDFELMVVRKGQQIQVFIDDQLMHTWDKTSSVKLSQLTNLQVGLLARGDQAVTYSEYVMASTTAQMNQLLQRTVTFQLPEGFTVVANGKTLTTGQKVDMGTQVQVKLPQKEGFVYTVKVNGEPAPAAQGAATFVISGDSQIEATMEAAYPVSGTVGTANGSITAVNTQTGASYSYENALVDGAYSILLPDGTFKLYIDCGKEEGILEPVTVNGAALTEQNLSKLYQKPTILKDGDAGTANWVLTGNGRYEVQTSDESANSISMGWFEEIADMNATDFIIETDVQAAGNTNVLLGLAISGKNSAGKAETVVFGLVNNSRQAIIRTLWENGWLASRDAQTDYDRTSFHLTIVKYDNRISYFIDGKIAVQWANHEYNFEGWKNAKVGLGIYRMQDVTFSDYSYSEDAADIQAYFPNGTADIWDEFSKDYAQTLAQRYEKRGEDGKTTLFIGDSFFDSRAYWTEFATDLDGKNVMNAGIAASTAFDWENYMQNDLFLTGISPKNIVMNIGTNDLYDDHKSAEETLTRLQRMFTLMHQELPQTNIYYFSICKRQDATYSQQVDQVNAAMKTWCQDKDWITFVDVSGEMTTEDLKDGVHPKNECYPQVYLPALENAGCEMEVVLTYAVSGTVEGGLNGTVKAISLADSELAFAAEVVDGAYSVKVPDGSYKLYFDFGETEGLIPSVTVGGAAVTAPTLAKTYQKLTPANYGATFNGTNVLLDNGVYQLSGVGNGNANAAANFAGTYNNFVVKTHVKSANGQVGIIMHGVDGYSSGVQINLQSNGYLSFYGWDIGWQGGGNVSGYNANGFDMTIVHKDATVYVFIGDTLVKTWEGSAGNVALSKLTDVQVGLLVRGTVGATYSDYSISGSAEDIEAALSATLTYENLPEGVEVSAASGSVLALGTEVTVSGLNAQGAAYTVKVNGKAIAVADGQAKFKMEKDSVLEISASYTQVLSGTVAGSLNGTVKATDLANTDLTYQGTLTNGAYSLEVPSGSYKLYFDCGDTEGMIASVVVDGAAVTAPTLEKTYQKLTPAKYGGAGYNGVSALLDNGVYQISGVGDGNANAAANFAGTYNDFVVKAHVKSANGQIGIIMHGVDGYSNGVQINLQSNGYLSFYGWDTGWQGGGNVSGYSAEGFDLVIARKGTTIKVYINETLVKTWEGSAGNVALSKITDVQIGLYVRGTVGATYSDYSISSKTEDIDAAMAGFKHTISGTITSGVSGTFTATNLDNTALTYPGTLTDGVYSEEVPNGTYKLYFDCGDTEGLIPSVVVNNASVTAPTLAKTYQKLTPAKYGGAGYNGVSALLDNGVYQISGVGDGNANAAANFAGTYNDFVVKAHVKSANGQIGIIMHGVDGYSNGVQINLQSNGYLSFYGWDTGWQGGGNVSGYSAEGFDLVIARKGTTIKVYINEVLVKTWEGSAGNVALSKITDVQIGLYVRGTVGATYSDYSISGKAEDVDAAMSGVKTTLSGTITSGVSGTVTATDLSNTALTYPGTVTDGAYSIDLPKGTYKLYFDCGDTEGLIPSVAVSGASVTAPTLEKTYQKLLGTLKAGTNTGNWVLVDNGKYEVQTTNASTDGITMGYFAEGVDMNTTDFVIETDVQAAGTKSVMLGLALNGKNGSYTNATMVFGLNNANTTAQLRTFNSGSDWPSKGYHSSVVYADGDRTNFHLKIVKTGDKVSYFIDGAETATCNWSASDFNFGTWTNVKVGLGFYRSFDVTFSNYSYTVTTAQ